MAVSSGFVIWVVLDAVLDMPMDHEWEYTVVASVSILVSALIVGYVFAGKIREESRMISIGKIVVMSAFVMIFLTVTSYAAINPHYTNLVDQEFNATSTSSWKPIDWYNNELMALFWNTGISVLEVLALSFVGLYVGSMRKPSAKTKE
jgi:hypothetical protein